MTIADLFKRVPFVLIHNLKSCGWPSCSDAKTSYPEFEDS